MAFQALVITDAGKELVTRALAGATLTFTRAQMGDGTLTSQSIPALTALVNPVISLPVALVSHKDDTATISANFSNIVTDTFTGDGSTKTFALSAWPTSLSSVTVNAAASTDYTYTAGSGKIVFGTAPASGAMIGVGYNMAAFNWREVGVFAADPDSPNDRSKDILYCYQNAGAEPYPIPAPDPTPYTERISVKIYVAQAQNITVTVASGTSAAGISFDSDGVEGVTADTIQGAIAEIATAVAGKADAADVTALETEVEGKANAAHTHGNLSSDGKLTDAATGAAAGTGLLPVFAGTDAAIGVLTIPQAQQALKISTIATATATLAVASWDASGKTQTVSVTGVKADNEVIVRPAPASHTAWLDAGVYCSAQGAGTLTFTCEDVPESALTANVLIVEVAG